MTPRTPDASRRLRALAAELQAVGGAIAACDFRRPATSGALPLRPTPATSSLAAGPPRALPASSSSSSSSSSSGAAASPTARGSLYSVVSAAAYSAKRSAASRRPQSWQDALRRLAAERADGEAAERAERLRRRHESLAATVRVLEERLRRPADEVTLNDRVESQLEREEKQWEAQMQRREQAVAELEVELNALRDDQETDEDDEQETDEDGDGGGEQEDEQEDDDGQDDEQREEAVARLEARGRELREALALRAEEKRDIEAAVDSLRRKRRRRAPSSADEQQGQEQEQDGAAPAPKRPRVESQRSRELEGELITLRAAKEALEREILAAERRSEELDEHKHELPALRAEIDARRRERDALQERVEARKLQLARLKHKTKHMVDVQLLTARDTSPPTLREEAVLLHLLFEHAGELGVNELKQQTAAVMQEHGKPPNSAAVIRALYSLVANGVVQIDRSYGNGLVTSLLV